MKEPVQLDFHGIDHILPRTMTHAVIDSYQGEVRVLGLHPYEDAALMWIRSDIGNWDHLTEGVDPMKMDAKQLSALYTGDDDPKDTWMIVAELDQPIKVIG